MRQTIPRCSAAGCNCANVAAAGDGCVWDEEWESAVTDKARHALNELCELAGRTGSASYVTALRFDLLHALANRRVEEKTVVGSTPIAWICEDELPRGFPYAELFEHSKVDIVRMFPVFGPPKSLEASE